MFSSEFLNLGKEYKGNYIEKVNLDDEFTITYSSGSTNSSRPKAIVHDVKSYIVMGIYSIFYSLLRKCHISAK